MAQEQVVRVIRQRHDEASWNLGLDLQGQEGYKKVLCIALWRWQWLFEFGSGDSYDWD